MKFSKSILTFALAFGALLTSPASAQAEKDDKIGTVNMQKLVAEYYKTAETRASFKVYEKQINEQKDTRIARIKAIDEEALKLQKQVEDPSLAREKKEEIFKELNRKQQELRAQKEDIEGWIERKQAALTEKAKIDFGKVRMELIEQVKAYGEAEGFDFIFDRSGASNTGVAILSYTKDASDLTGILLEIVNKDAPAKEEGEEDSEGE